MPEHHVYVLGVQHLDPDPILWVLVSPEEYDLEDDRLTILKLFAQVAARDTADTPGAPDEFWWFNDFRIHDEDGRLSIARESLSELLAHAQTHDTDRWLAILRRAPDAEEMPAAEYLPERPQRERYKRRRR